MLQTYVYPFVKFYVIIPLFATNHYLKSKLKVAMEEKKSGGRCRFIAGCFTVLALIIICVLCTSGGYIYWSGTSTELVAYTTEITIGGTNVAQWVGLSEATSTPTLAAVSSATPLPPEIQPTTVISATVTTTATPSLTPSFVKGTATLPPTDTPPPQPTTTATDSPTLVPPTPGSITQTATATTTQPDVSATEVTEAIFGILTSPEIIGGSINLVTIEHEHVFGPGVAEVEFSWLWSGSSDCLSLPDGYGFDVRIWPNRPDFSPLGISDIVDVQDEIACDLETGRRFYKVGFLSGSPAVQIQGAGSFLWDVAMVATSPYTPLYASPARSFEISLDYPDPGPLDPHGVIGTVSCSSFSAWAEAQAFFLAADINDPHSLDSDKNGVACDEIAPCLLKQSAADCRAKFSGE